MEILKEMGVPNHLTCLSETCVRVKKQQLEPDMEQIDWFGKIGKEHDKAM